MSDNVRRWIWPLPPLSQDASLKLLELSTTLDREKSVWLLYLATAMIGVLPVFVCCWIGVPLHQWLSALLFFPVFLGCVAKGRALRAWLLVALVMASHSATVVAYAFYACDVIAPLTPGAASFWEESLHWIKTGEQPEYELNIWLPKHMLLIFAVLVLGYCSLGLTVLHRGFEEVDLMNYYVGRLLAESDYAAVALLGGWHIWSLLRGAGYTILIFEISLFSFGRLSASAKAQSPVSYSRIALGLAFLGLDVLCKFMLIDSVREMLNRHLLR